MRKIVLDDAVLRDLIERQKMQQWMAAEVLCVSIDTIRRNCKRIGITTQRTGPRSGHLHTGWKGGVRIVKGYRYIYRPDHPCATLSGYVSEHRLVMEQTIGRLLAREEVVHHLNEDALDNRPDNLVPYSSNAEHLRETLKGRIPKWTAEGKARIAAGQKKGTNQILSGVGVPQRNQTNGQWLAKPDKPSLEA